MKNLIFRPAFDLQRPNAWHKDWTSLQRAMEGFFDDLHAPTAVSKDLERAAFNPPCDIKEGDSEYLVSLDVPGMRKEDIAIEVSDGVLTISGERKNEHAEDEGKTHRVERFRGAFARSFALPPGTDANHVRASYKDGVLRLLVPKPSVNQKQQVRIDEDLASGKGPATQH